MKYIIYSLVAPAHLKHRNDGGYYNTSFVDRYVLEELDVPFMESRYETMDAALYMISGNADKLKSMSLAVLPIINIGWDGSI